MHCMIDLTVYFLFFIAFADCAVVKNKAGTEEDLLRMNKEAEPIPARDKQRIVFLFRSQDGNIITANVDEDASIKNGTDTAVTEQHDADPWSVIWYLGAFSGLITFFLVVTCSEWCCGNHLYTRHYGTNQIYANSFTQSYRPPETPPPPYHLFAPPSYSDSVKNCQEKQKPAKKPSIFIIPIHRNKNSTTAAT